MIEPARSSSRPPEPVREPTGEQVFGREEPLRQRVGRRLALFAGGAALAFSVLAFLALAPIQQAALERVASEQIGLLAEAVAASYQAVPAEPAATGAAAVAEAERKSEEPAAAAPQKAVVAHRAAEILDQLRHAESISFIDIIGHDGRIRHSTEPAHVGAVRELPRRLRDVVVRDEQLVVSYAMPFTNACAQCHDARQDPIGAVQVGVRREVAFSSLERFQMFYAAVVFLTFLILVAVVLVVTERWVARPVFRLARLMKRAEKGDFLVRARVEADDELGALAMAFNQMLRSLTTLKASELEREAQLRQAAAELSMKNQLAEIAERLQSSNTELERRVQAQTLLMEAAHRLGSTLDKQALVERVGRLIAEKLDRPDFAIYLVEAGSEGEVELSVAHAAGIFDRVEVRALRFKSGEGITGFVADTGAPMLIPNLSEPPPMPSGGSGPHTAGHPSGIPAPSGQESSKHSSAEGRGIPAPTGRESSKHSSAEGGGIRSHRLRELMPEQGALLCVPMLHKGRVVGVIDLYAREPHAFDADDTALLQALCAQIAMALVNADLYQATLELSVTDPLTQLMNRRALNRVLDAELVRAQRFNTPLVVLMLDVDHFKQYNDRMGHLLGDEALKAVAHVLQASIRKVDAVARFGGEEFCVILPRTEEGQGVDVAEKLLRAVRGLTLPGAANQPLGRISISVGLGVYPDDMPPAFDGGVADVILGAADRAAYEAKRRGRDRVVTHGEMNGRVRRPKLNEPSVANEKPKLPS